MMNESIHQMELYGPTLWDAGILMDKNVNLTSSQKEPLHWHYQLCHQDFALYNDYCILVDRVNHCSQGLLLTLKFFIVQHVSIPKQNATQQQQKLTSKYPPNHLHKMQ